MTTISITKHVYASGGTVEIIKKDIKGKTFIQMDISYESPDTEEFNNVNDRTHLIVTLSPDHAMRMLKDINALITDELIGNG